MPSKKSATLDSPTPVARTERVYVRVDCETPEPPQPADASATTCKDAMVEDTEAKTGPWAQLMAQYRDLAACVRRHMEKAQ